MSFDEMLSRCIRMAAESGESIELWVGHGYGIADCTDGEYGAAACVRGKRPSAEATGVDLDDAVTKLHLQLLSRLA